MKINSFHKNKMNLKKEILNLLSGIEQHLPTERDSFYNFYNISTGNFDPPAYIVAYIFFEILGFKNFGGYEKVWWHTYFRYKGHVFLIRDYKFGSWSIETNDNTGKAKKILSEVIGKIRGAAGQADKIIQRKLKEEISKENFFINNVYFKLQSLFHHYLEELENAIANFNEFQEEARQNKIGIQKIIDSHKKRIRLENIVSYKAFPLIMAFFSFLEFILDVFYAFERPQISFFEFRKLSWSERFKKVIDLNKYGKLKRYYERLIIIKRNYRNPLSHGLINESALLVPFPFGGLVPISYEHLSDTINFGFVQITIKSALDLIKIFKGFLQELSNLEPFSFYLKFAEYGFPLPINKDEANKIKREMISAESFENYLKDRSMYEDMLINRDI